MIERVTRLIKLDFSVFKDIESDPQATMEAAIIVGATTFLSAIASAMGSEHAFGTFVISVINGLIGWVVWSAVTYFIGKTVFSGGGTLEQMLRVIGYANAPRILGILTVIPCIGWLGGLAGLLISLVASIMAIKEALDVELGTAIAVIIVGAIAMAIVSAIIGIVLGSVFAISVGMTQLLFGQ